MSARHAFPGLSPTGSRIGTEIAREFFALRGNPRNLMLDEQAVALLAARAADEALKHAIGKQP